MKIIILFLTLCVSFVCAKTTGSYRSLNFDLKYRLQTSTFKDAPDGGIDYAYGYSTYTITNTKLLQEAQRVGIMPAGSLSGWRIVSFSESVEPIGIYAYHKAKNKVYNISSIIDINPDLGYILKGSARFNKKNMPMFYVGSLDGVILTKIRYRGVVIDIFSRVTEKQKILKNSAGDRYVHSYLNDVKSSVGRGTNNSFVYGDITFGDSIPVVDLDLIN